MSVPIISEAVAVEIARLRLERDDVLVVKVPAAWSLPRTLGEVRGILSAWIADHHPGTPLLVLPHGAELSTASLEDLSNLSGLVDAQISKRLAELGG